MSSKECEEQLKSLVEAWDLDEACLNATDIEAIKHLMLENQMQHKEILDVRKQLEYLRSGEYLNQLKFERNMLENIVQNMEVSKEDKEFIDMAHRNTELLEENQKLKKKYENAVADYEYEKSKNHRAIEYIEETTKKNDELNCTKLLAVNQVEKLLEILKEDNKEE